LALPLVFPLQIAPPPLSSSSTPPAGERP
jgi:hypothetical protein